MNASKLTTKNEETNSENYFVNLASRVMPHTQNGTQAGVNALAESLKRGDAYLKAQQKLNEVCLPEPAILSNTFIKEGVSHV